MYFKKFCAYSATSILNGIKAKTDTEYFEFQNVFVNHNTCSSLRKFGQVPNKSVECNWVRFNYSC